MHTDLADYHRSYDREPWLFNPDPNVNYRLQYLAFYVRSST